MNRVLVINPGGSSTKIAVYEGERQILKETIPYPKTVASFDDIMRARDGIERAITDALARHGVAPDSLDAIVGRGGALKPIESGTYRANATLAEDIRDGRVQAKHPSNLGGLLAYELGERLGKPGFMVDPVSVDEFDPEARLSGLPELPRRSLDHPLNSKMVARKAAAELGRSYSEINVIVAHLGTGTSVSAHRRGRAVDVNNAQDGGPFSTQRAGFLPATQLVDLCFSGRYTREEMLARLTYSGGLKAHLGTENLPEIERRACHGDEHAALVLRAMAYAVAKEIGASAAVLAGEVDAIVFTGGIAFSDYVIKLVWERVAFLTPHIFVYPGEHEMEALAEGALRVLRGEEAAKEYR